MGGFKAQRLGMKRLSAGATAAALLVLVLVAFASSAFAQGVVSGITRAKLDLKLSLPVAGRVEQLAVNEGDRVRKGDLILSLDKTLEALEVDRRKLLLDDVAKLGELRLREGVLREQVANARSLLVTQVMSRKQVEDEEMVYREVLAQLGGLEMAKKRDRVEYELAQEALARRILRAPADGTIAKIHFRVGESLAANEPAVGLVDITRVRFVGTLPASAAARLTVGMTARLALARDGGEIVRQARVSFVSPLTDAASGLVEVIAEFDNADRAVRPGIAGQMQIDVGAGRGVLPAVQRASDRAK
jgi:RND family efflux transporter MFP subunit